MPTPNPRIRRPPDQDPRARSDRFDHDAERERGCADENGAAAAELVGHAAGDERSTERTQRHPARHDLRDERAGVQAFLDAGERAADDALIVTKQKSGERDGARDEQEPIADVRSACGFAAIGCNGPVTLVNIYTHVRNPLFIAKSSGRRSPGCCLDPDPRVCKRPGAGRRSDR